MADEVTKETGTIKEVDVKGYKFTVDTDLLDDIKTLDLIDRIENQGHVAAILPLLKHILGTKEFEKMEKHFIAADATDNADKKDYVPRMRMTLLQPIYMAIIEKFDPKG